MGKKGLSFEEKRQRLKQLFLETGVYTLKELEKVASKEKGIALHAKATELRKSIDAMMADRVDSPERTAGLEELKELQQKKAQLSEELAVYAENNIFSLRKYCETKFSISGSDFDRNFQIPEDFDYLS
eukprot:m51a1_g14467 hypothetical protein (128) ;mRNA; r:671058-671778